MKLYRLNDLRGNENYFELAGGSSYEGNITVKCMKEIQDKSILVRVSEGSSYRESTVMRNGFEVLV